jgi:hypothetical protein
MFQSDELKSHFEESSTIKTQALIFAEWNMNMPENIQLLGNYRYRPQDSDITYRNIPTSFDQADAGNFYTGATDADIIIDAGVDDEETPSPRFLQLTKDKMKMIYSLEDCIKPFRPRSGINKASYFNTRYLANSGPNMFRRPRYYMAAKDDQFRYWSSYRTEDNIEQGVANKVVNGAYFINDAAPFVVYKESVPANRIVVKMQTNVGDLDLGPFTTSATNIDDPFFGEANKTTPIRWRIQYLQNNNWVDAQVFTESSVRDNGDPVIGTDGYVELQYGLIIPKDYSDIFVFVEKLSSDTLLPSESLNGYGYLVVENEEDAGTLYIWNSAIEDYIESPAEYGWSLQNEDITSKTVFVTDLTSPDFFVENLVTKYREFEYIQGIRVVVETMNKFDSTFDLIEMSPRLVADITDSIKDYSVTKVLSDLNDGALPVGQLLASTGSINIFDYDQSFNSLNTESIVSKYLDKNIKFNFYEVIKEVGAYDYFVPIKTLYSEGINDASDNPVNISAELRDLYFYFESMPAPRLLVTNASLSYAVSTLLDYIGFTNYKFYRLDNENDPIIPYFFVGPDQNVAEVLAQLAVSTQSAMFFDEYNNFIVMSKNYMLPSNEERDINFSLIGTKSQTQNGIIKNYSASSQLPNILAISSKEKKVYNDGKINFTQRYIQRSYGSIRQASLVDSDKNWIYKPALLWEVSGTETTKTINEQVSQQGKYVLGAMPINSDLTDQVPQVVKNRLINNIIDLGENVYWLTRNQGYFYANGEIIRYDAVEYNVTGIGNVWISSNQEYQNYFSKLPFNGKIYPTGNVRIFSTPYYETIDGIDRLQNGEVYEHGRGQFGTPVVYHYAGLNSHWSNNSNARGCLMDSNLLFNTKDVDFLKSGEDYPETEIGKAGLDSDVAGASNLYLSSSRNGVLKNFLSSSNITETEANYLKSTQTGTVQSSAFIMNGPVFSSTQSPLNYVSYVYKPLTDGAYRHFGTRMRIIGKIENNLNRLQTAAGSTSYYQVPSTQPDVSLNIDGGSGGIGVMVNPNTNNGYYFEIVALTQNNIESYMRNNTENNVEQNVYINNVVFYKVMRNADESTGDTDLAVPVKLWGGLAKILVDDGKFTGQYRMAGEENPTVYDLSVEYQQIGGTLRFYLFINNRLIATVDDTNPLPITSNVALFTRGSSRCMFENIYAVSENYSQNTVFTVGETLSKVFGDKEININEALRKYSMSGIVQSTYLSGISSLEPPKYNMYFEEFGTIMRECAYFNIKYDRAYPALYATLSPTFNRIKGYTTSGFYADSYGAEFLVFNSTDTALNLDETTGNYLRIQGITFTQDTTYEYTVDEYFKKNANLSSPQLQGDTLVRSPLVEKAKFDEIKLSRMVYGKNEFTLETPYIQTQDDAEDLMGWIIGKILKPKKLVGVEIFAIPTIQLGDIVTIDYKDNNIDMVASEDTRFVVYNIEYSRSTEGPSMTLYLSEV